MFERFTERARRVIILAREEAGRFRHDFVGTEHVLLGLIRDGEGIATAVLQRLGLRLETVKAEVERDDRFRELVSIAKRLGRKARVPP